MTPAMSRTGADAALRALVYELLDAHLDTIELAQRAHLDYLRALERTGRALLAVAAPPPLAPPPAAVASATPRTPPTPAISPPPPPTSTRTPAPPPPPPPPLRHAPPPPGPRRHPPCVSDPRRSPTPPFSSGSCWPSPSAGWCGCGVAWRERCSAGAGPHRRSRSCSRCWSGFPPTSGIRPPPGPLRRVPACPAPSRSTSRSWRC